VDDRRAGSPLSGGPPSLAVTDATPRTRLQWFQDLAGNALREGQCALAAGDLARARSWLEHAHRIAPADVTATLALAVLLLRAGEPGRVAGLLDPIAAEADQREIWLFLVAAGTAIGATDAAAAALVRALSGHVLADAEGFRTLAGAVARAAAAPGWCGVDADLLVVAEPCGGKVSRLRFNGAAWRGPRQAPGTPSLAVTLDGCHLLGSPIDLARIRRVEAVVRVDGGGLSGWAWMPGNPDTDPVLTVRGSGAGPAFSIRADGLGATATQALARPRDFHIPAADLAGLSGMLHVTGADGRDVAGSPLDPGAEARGAAAVARAVARLFPAFGPPAPQPGDAALAVVGVQADLRGPPADAPAWPDRHVAVVVPVHDAPRMTLDCLDSVFATVPAGTGVIVVDDASRDPGLVAALDGMAASGRIRLLRHAVNLGFPASANAGLRAAMAEGGDAVLLNSDTLVTPGWLDGLRACVHAGGDIGTATPLSNNGSILSYPDPDRLGSVPDAAAANRLARLAARADAAAGIDIPTAVGFCMYVRRECLQAVGVFRTDLFAQGYGEENDFCLRARHLGWRSVAATGVFVAHLGGRSFGLSTSRLIERNLDVIERLHPGYGALIDAHHAADPLAGARRRLDIARWEASFARPRRGAVADAGPVVLITHDNGGGVERVVRRRCADLAAEGRRAIVLRPVPARSGPKGTVPGQCVVGDGADGGFPNLRFAVPRELDVLARLLGRSRPTSLEVHHLMEHEHALLRLGRLLDVPVDMHLHDYAAFCPRVTLLNPARQYCGEPADPAVCDACVADGGRAAGDDLPVAALRARSAAALRRRAAWWCRPPMPHRGCAAIFPRSARWCAGWRTTSRSRRRRRCVSVRSGVSA